MMISKIKLITTVALLLAFPFTFFASCKAERYKVICEDGLFTNVKKSYRPGSKVKIYFPYVATDTDYSFYLDGERYHDYTYSDRHGFIFTFTMPDHDVTLTFDSRNSMENTVYAYEAGTMLVTYRETVSSADGDSLYELTVEATEDEGQHKMTVTKDGEKTEYLIPMFPYHACYNYVESERLWDWNELVQYESLDGKQITFSVLVDGDYVVISSDKMPEFGEGVLNYLHAKFTDYMTDAYKQ